MEEGKENAGHGDLMVVEGDSQKEKVKGKRKNLKRKRAFVDAIGGALDRESLLGRCRQELDELFRYFGGALVPRLDVGDAAIGSNDSLIACLMEGSGLTLQKLAEEIFQTLKVREGITVESLLRDVPFVGSRIRYGVGDGDLNLGEDESESCLWCWEARETSLLPRSQRAVVKHLRLARKKVRARVTALSGTIASLSVSSSNEQSDLLRATEKLEQESDISEIRFFVENSLHKKMENKVEREAKVKEKVLKEIEKNNLIAEKEKKRKERELQKEKAQSEKELKRLKVEADKEERRREREEMELRKQLRRQQNEADKEQKRREKEEVECKMKLSVRRQANLMEKFLKKSNKIEDDIKTPEKDVMLKFSERNEGIVDTFTSSMDLALTKQDDIMTEDLQRSHFAVWRKLCHFNRSQHWGVRQKAKTELIKELKLHGTTVLDASGKATIAEKGNTWNKQNGENDSSLDKTKNEIEILSDDLLGSSDANISLSTIKLPNRTRKLLQFDKSHRPAYYGTWSQKSHVIGPRHPFVKDPALDYDVDSDEEWEEEEPGESLTDCDKDEEEDMEDSKADMDDENDSFLVPDGYLSENEGIRWDAMDDEVESSPSSVSETEKEEFRALVQLQKHLSSLTEKALRKCQPLIISNLTHEKTELLVADNLSGTDRIEQICLRSLCMQGYPGGRAVDITTDNPVEDGEVICNPCNGNASHGTPIVLSDPDMLEFVKSIQSHPQGISKVIESLQNKFPTISKTGLRSKIREFADFVDNHHWQVKTEVLKKLGLPISPGRPRKHKIASFFSKRCVPPTGEVINVVDSSPSSCYQKAGNNSQDHEENSIVP